MRRLDESIPEQKSRMSVAFLLTAAKNQKIYSRTEFGLAAKKSITTGSVGR